MTVVAAQLAPVIGEPERNRRTAAGAVREAVSAGAQLVVLPELCDSGYVFESKQEARDLGVFVAVADRCGTERGVDWISGSVIIGPDGDPLELGNRSNASAEVEYDGAVAWLVGEEGHGVRTIIEMVNMTRLDCVLGAATSMRSGAVQAAHHAAHRSAFGALLADQPLMANVLADLAVESEAATAVTFRLAGATDRAAAGDEQEAAFRRLALAATKYWVCKRAPAHAAEALECFGGNGYVEESGLPRLYRMPSGPAGPSST